MYSLGEKGIRYFHQKWTLSKTPQILCAVLFRYVKQCSIVFPLVFEILCNLCKEPLNFSKQCAFFAYVYFLSKTKGNPAKIKSEQWSSDKLKPTCEYSAIFGHFQRWLKKLGDVLACSFSIFPSFRLTLTRLSHFHC